MSDQSINAPLKKGSVKSAWVWFEGATALKEGQGVCCNSDYGTDTDSDARRMNRVEMPSADNKTFFAGVAARNYSAKAGGQMIEIYEPGSVCTILVAIGVSAVVGVTALECTYVAGTFKAATNNGKGVATALQTITGGAAALPCLAVLREGLPSVGLAD